MVMNQIRKCLYQNTDLPPESFRLTIRGKVYIERVKWILNNIVGIHSHFSPVLTTYLPW